ncbi:MAG: hypothetical protein KJ905_02595 [Nanoarchaeota archaeon]|nr:hypothetical protein [Nanoarchaeota archaeon]MBU1501639.1 hypothetical protein [Nanoarchaeota archaeon]MBU2458901.1 hypothetical protein [Nanoarchaeota archaeon]
MEKRLVFLGILFVFVIATLSLVSAAINQTSETDKVENAYSCLNEKVQGNCAALSAEEKIFSLLSIGQCRSEILSSSTNDECWASSGSSSCKLKTTAEAILALKNSNAGNRVQAAEDWLLSQNRKPSEITWYLQVETPEASTCTVGYSGLSYSFNILEDKTLSGNPGPGLSISVGSYWLQISPNSYDAEFEVSCNKDFMTSLLFKKSLSSTIHVFPESSSASAGGLTKEKVESLCFSENNICNYEGSLWAAFVLNAQGEDVSAYLPYLITLAEDNDRYLPDSFLYSILQSADNKVSLLSQQIGNKWWAVSGNKYYDTALALQPFQGETLTEKTNAKQWLFDVQGSDGCWDSGNIRNTAFILSSIWSGLGSSFSGSSSSGSCESSGNYCVSSGSCGGSIISGSTCSGFSSTCCTLPSAQLTCAELSGNLCSSNEICSRGDFVSSSDSLGKTCCVGDTCQVYSGGTDGLSECEQKGGVCRTTGADLNGEESISYDCAFQGDACYISKSSNSSSESSTSGSSYLWIWIMLTLIIIAVVGIIYKEKVRHLWLRIKSKFGKSGPASSSGPRRPPFGFPPSSPRPMPPRYPHTERRILPQPSRPNPVQRRPERSPASKELDEVLKKLKDMSK